MRANGMEGTGMRCVRWPTSVRGEGAGEGERVVGGAAEGDPGRLATLLLTSCNCDRAVASRDVVMLRALLLPSPPLPGSRTDGSMAAPTATGSSGGEPSYADVLELAPPTLPRPVVTGDAPSAAAAYASPWYSTTALRGKRGSGGKPSPSGASGSPNAQV